MKRIAAALLALLLCVPAFGFSPTEQLVLFSGGFKSCATSAAFVARTSGLNNVQKNAYGKLICGLVDDGVITGNLGTTGCGTASDSIDIFYITAGSSAANSDLNICGTSYTLSEQSGPITYTAAGGYSGNGTSQFIVPGALGSGYKPAGAGSTCGNGSSACNLAVNTSTCGMYIGGNRTTLNGGTIINWGAQDGANMFRLMAYDNAVASTGIYSMDTSNAQNSSSTGNPRTPGFWIQSRTSSVNSTMRQYDTGGPFASSSATGSTAVALTKEIYLLAFNNNGSSANWAPSSDPMEAFFCGGLMSTAKQDAMSNRVNQFMIDVGATYHY